MESLLSLLRVHRDHQLIPSSPDIHRAQRFPGLDNVSPYLEVYGNRWKPRTDN